MTLYLNIELYPTIVNRQYYDITSDNNLLGFHCSEDTALHQCQTQLEETHFQTCSLGVIPIMNFCNLEYLLLKLLSARLPIVLHLEQL